MLELWFPKASPGIPSAFSTSAGLSMLFPRLYTTPHLVLAELIFSPTVKAFGLIVRRINDEPFDVPSVPGSRAVTIKFMIPNSRMGSVIGKQGSKIKEIQDASGARLTASEGMLPGSTEVSFKICQSHLGLTIGFDPSASLECSRRSGCYSHCNLLRRQHSDRGARKRALIFPQHLELPTQLSKTASWWFLIRPRQ